MSDKIVVLSARPASVKKIFTLDFGKGSPTPLSRRENKEFGKWFDIILKELGE